MKIKHLISSLLLSASLVTAGALFASQEKVEKAEAATSYSCSEMVIYDDVGWCFSTLKLQNFGFESGYSNSDFKKFAQIYYVTEKTSWDKQGTVRAWKSSSNDTVFNLCAGGAVGQGKQFSFLLPSWVSYCEIFVENNSNSYCMGYLNNIRHYSNNESDFIGSAVNKTVTFYAKSWGADSVMGSSKTTTDFSASLTSIGKTRAGTEIGRKTETVNKFEHVPDYSISGYTFVGWFSDSSLNNSFSEIVGSSTTLYAEFATPRIKIGDDYYNLSVNPDNVNELTVSNLNVTSGLSVDYYHGTTLVQTSAKNVGNNNMTSSKTVLVNATSVSAYIDISANTIWLGGLPLGGFHMIINGSRLVHMSDGGEYEGYTQYKSEMIAFSVNDTIQTVDCGGASSLPAVFTIDNIVQSGLGSNFTVENGVLKCTTAVSARVFMKMRSDRNEIYFGDVEEYVTKAINFASGFNTAISAKCSSTGATNVSQLASAWSGQVTLFTELEEESRDYLKEITGEESPILATFLEKYMYVATKYKTQLGNNYNFLSKTIPSGSNFIPMTTIQANASTTIIIVVVVGVAAIAVGGYFLLRKKKEN